jgi:hypothetical protein
VQEVPRIAGRRFAFTREDTGKELGTAAGRVQASKQGAPRQTEARGDRQCWHGQQWHSPYPARRRVGEMFSDEIVPLSYVYS